MGGTCVTWRGPSLYQLRHFLLCVIGFAELSVLVNSAPYGGHIEASPREGTAALDSFLLESLDWTDEADDLPLLFSFYYANGQVFCGRIIVDAMV